MLKLGVPEGNLAGFVVCVFCNLAGPGGPGQSSKMWGGLLLPPNKIVEGLPGFWGRPDCKNASPKIFEKVPIQPPLGPILGTPALGFLR